MPPILKHSHFFPNPFGHGGDKRTAQINYLLAEAGIDFQEADFYNYAAPNQRLQQYVNGLFYYQNFKRSTRITYATGRYIQLFDDFLKANKPELLIWESTVEYFLLLPEICRRHKIPVIALPHNLESLVGGTRNVFSKKQSPDWLLDEIKYLSYCNKVFTISREEMWLLGNCGIEAGYLPYYSTGAVNEFLKDVRRRRETFRSTPGNQKQILLLGTFHNKPTAEGFIDLINNIKHVNNLTIAITGYGSGQISDLFNADHIKNYGAVDNEQLARLIIQSDYAVIHQPPSSGALTRIPELLVAGIPVLANVHAARNYFDYDGVTVYHSYEELLKLVNSDLPPVAPLPRPNAEERLFIDCVKSFIK